jgi:hypothetical protein
MNFYTITQENEINVIAEAIVAREQEIFYYDMNITNYTILTSTLPQDDWPANLVSYKQLPLEQVPDEFYDIVNEYQYRDRIKILLKTEKTERNKSVKIYETLLSRLPEENRAEIIAAAKLRIEERAQQNQKV